MNGDFYHRYRQMFALPHEYPLKTKLANLSPAIDEFNRSVLPKINRPFPQLKIESISTQLPKMQQGDKYQANFIDFKQKYGDQPNKYEAIDRLKNEFHENTTRLKRKLYNSNEIYNQPLSVKKQQPFRKDYKQQVVQYRKMATQPSQPAQYLSHKGGHLTDITKSIEELQKMYMGGYRKKIIKANFLPQKNKSLTLETQQNLAANDRSRQYRNSNPLYGGYLKKWQTKILPLSQSRKRQASISPRKQDENITLSPQKRAQQMRKKQLYLEEDNQYAFANGKIQQIKRVNKISRNHLNNYKECLLRRNYAKMKLDVRRQKLKEMLEKQLH